MTTAEVATTGAAIAVVGTLLAARWGARANLGAVELNSRSQHAHWLYQQRFVYFVEFVDEVNRLLFLHDKGGTTFGPAEIEKWTDAISRAATRARFLSPEQGLTSRIKAAEHEAYKLIRSWAKTTYAKELIDSLMTLEGAFTAYLAG
jgi:hypothetical protein